MRASRSFIASLILRKRESWEGLTDPVLPVGTSLTCR